MVDNKAIALTPAVELSYLTQQEQRMLHNIMQMEGATRPFPKRSGCAA